MDQTDQLIIHAAPLKQPQLTIETNFGKKYTADLSRFKAVYCYPKTQIEWEDFSISTNGYALTWGSRFEVHVDQIIAEATSIENTHKAVGE